MPIHLIPASRRQFLQATLAGGIASFASDVTAATSHHANRWALLADTHIAGDEKTVARGANMFDNLNRVIDEVIAEDPRPSGVIINGDCAYLKGFAADYATFKRAIDRLVDTGIPVHMTMGNHDDRGPLYETLAEHKPQNALVMGKHVAVLESPFANLYLLDSLRIVDNVTGELGQAQRQWLSESLKQRDDKPAIIIGHHNLQFRPKGSTAKISGLADTDELVELMHSHSNVQAYIFGHTHDWKLSRTADGVHLVNQPPCAYVFNEAKPNGWVRLSLGEDEFSVELRALDKSHQQHGDKHSLSHRLAATN